MARGVLILFFFKSLYMNKYKQNTTFQDRRNEVDRIFKKYPDRIPCFIYKNPKSTLQSVEKNKFLIPNDITIPQLHCVIRKRIKLDPKEGLFILINEETCMNSTRTLEYIYDEYKDQDGFLYICYSSENVFGHL
jgi:GABA(A) receptor-associated protein